MNKKRICIIGVGGGGSKIVEWIQPLATEGPRLAIINTDTKALDDCKIPRKIKIGQLYTGGTGTGGNIEAGKKSAEEDIEKIIPLFNKMDLIIFVASLGGGTGSGALPVILKKAKKENRLTLCFVTTPFSFEGDEKIRIAEKSMKKISAIADGVIQIPNDLLFHSVNTERQNIKQAFMKADETTATAIRSIWKLITNPGYINLDFANLANIMRGTGGTCSLAYGMGKGQNKAEHAIKELLESPLTKHGELLKESAAIMVSIVGGVDLALKEVGDIMDAIKQNGNPDIHLEMGTVIDEAWRNRLMVTVIYAEKWHPENITAEQEKDNTTTGSNISQEMLPLQDTPTIQSKTGTIPKKRKNAQENLTIASGAKNRFKGANATILYGEDMDIPTFKRRGISIPE